MNNKLDDSVESLFQSEDVTIASHSESLSAASVQRDSVGVGKLKFTAAFHFGPNLASH